MTTSPWPARRRYPHVPVEEATRSAIDWLCRSDEPAVRFLARRDLLGERSAADEDRILDGPRVRALLSGQRPDGGFGVHPYQKWTGAHWRLVSLVELAIPAGEPRAVRAAETVLAWLSPKPRPRHVVVAGRARAEASQEGNALAACCRLGLVGDPRVRRMAESLIEWQWPDGGWNCDRRAATRRSSFHESFAPAWGLTEYWQATGERHAKEAAERTAELFLEHRLFRSTRTGDVIHRSWVALHHPPYWHYDYLQGLLVLWRLGRLSDPRAADALDLLERQRLKDGRWRPGGYWWRPPGSVGSPEVVDWGRSGPNEMITLNALRVLRAAGRSS